MKLFLDRLYKKKEYTIGKLYLNGEYFCDTCEDVDRGINQNMNLSEILNTKVEHETAIPIGTYNITLNVQSPRFSKKAQYNFCNGFLPRLMNVPGFEGVLIHIGNKADHSEGCILVGQNKVRGQVVNSTATFVKLYEKLKVASDKGEKITIDIV